MVGKQSGADKKHWPKGTELVGIAFDLQPQSDCRLYPQYAIGLHAWFLDQVRQDDPALSAYLHDGGAEKAFTISRLAGIDQTQGNTLRLRRSQSYTWQVTALSKPLVTWLAQWLASAPKVLELRAAPLDICGWEAVPAATTYAALLKRAKAQAQQTDIKLTLPLSFTAPTSFRRKQQHFPLPLPTNVFQSYLRRWNDFAGVTYESEPFLAWVDERVVIRRHELKTSKVPAGKRGQVTGFTGAVEFGLTKEAVDEPDYIALFWALGELAPYCGTGHKTTFGLGQTVAGWYTESAALETAVGQLPDGLAERIEELTALFKEQRQRTGGDRAAQIAETWATILARREMGESLKGIAVDMEMPYETVKTYVKLARRAVREEG